MELHADAKLGLAVSLRLPRRSVDVLILGASRRERGVSRDGSSVEVVAGLVSDGRMAALIGRDGELALLCVPRFNSPPLFASIPDAA